MSAPATFDPVNGCWASLYPADAESDVVCLSAEVGPDGLCDKHRAAISTPAPLGCQCSPTCEHEAQPGRRYALAHTPAISQGYRSCPKCDKVHSHVIPCERVA